MGSNDQRLVMICIDSADISFVEEHLDSLPVLQRLFEQGHLLRLASDGGELGASVWPTFYTGKHPGDHGQYFPLQWDAGSMQMRSVGESHRFFDPFWYDVASASKPVVAFDVQLGFESRLPLGFEVHNWTGQSFSDLRSSQPELLKEIVRRFGRHPMGEDIPADWGSRQRRRMKRQIDRGIAQTGEITRWLLRRCEWQLSMTSFVEGHRAGHYLIDEGLDRGSGGWLLDVLQRIEREIELIIATLDMDRTLVMVFSLHGMGPSYSQMHHMSDLMERINKAFLERRSQGSATYRPQLSPMRFLRERLPSTLQGHIGRRSPTWLRDKVVGRQFDGGMRWAQTPGFALPCGGESFIRLNIKGRERDGFFEPGGSDLRTYTDWVERCLRSLKNGDTGVPLVREIIHSRDRFPGERTDLLPDIIVIWEDQKPAPKIRSDLLGTMRAKYYTGRQGLHRSGGFAVMIGAKTDGNPQLPQHIADLGDYVRGIMLP